jgi:tetratricopeptide (TPR) repeat protein
MSERRKPNPSGGVGAAARPNAGAPQFSGFFSLRLPEGSNNRPAIFAAALLILFAALAAYHNSFFAPFIFDDGEAIVDNATIRHLWPPWEALMPPVNGASVSSRPVLNFSYAVNYAISGYGVWSYHALNLLFHVLAALALFGIVRRTLLQPVLRERFGRDALPLALAVALLWAVHPLLTESVIVAAQRSESLMGLFYMLTLYAFIRGMDSPQPWWWYGCAITTCLLGLGTKEVMVTAPLLLLLYDRTFVAGTFREAWRRRARVYAGLAATWLLLASLELSTGGGRGDPEGLDVTLRWWEHVPIQSRAVITYLKLAFWPHPLVMDYGGALPPENSWLTAFQTAAVLALLAGTLWALWRRPALGFIGAGFFLILAPSTTIILLMNQVLAEHRMYLPLAAVVGLSVLGLYRLIGRPSLVLFAALAIGLAWLTFQRGENYRSALTIWSDTVAKRPNNPRALNNLGIALAQNGQVDEGIADLQKALAIRPGYAEAHCNLAFALLQKQEIDAAITQSREALKIRPDYAEAHNNLGNALFQKGQIADAIAHYKMAIALQPDYAEAHGNLGNALLQIGRSVEAIAQYQTALALQPDDAETHSNLGNALLQNGQTAPAIAHFEKALALQPDFAEAHNNLGNALFQKGQIAAAIAHYQKAIALQPDYPEAQNNLGNALLQNGQPVAAIAHYRTAIALRPDYAKAHTNLGVALVQNGRINEGILHLQMALAIQPGLVEAQNYLARIAWALATSPNPSLRDGAKAVELARQVDQLSGGKNPARAATLAAAYAETGDFADAIVTVQRALQLAAGQNNPAVVALLQTQLKLYQAGSPFRDTPLTP